ncbi:threonine synthase [Halobacteriales archaeon QH_10_67_22]|nr:MAG: threonine synthase [Halobacteriales archaeon QH_10_67_22]
METTAGFDGLVCTDCGSTHDATPGRCPDCGGALLVEYDPDGVTRDSLADRRFDGLGRYERFLPVPADRLVTMDEGTTPLVSCPDFADRLGVEAVYVKDEGANPTGSTADRGMAVAVAAARDHGAEQVALPTTGDAGQSAAAYAARADIESEAFVPTRSTFVAKAMTNVHGGEMSVVEGRYPDAVAAFEDAMAGEDDAGHSLAPFDTPYRQEGAKTLLCEVAEQLDWSLPDAVVHPTGDGLGVVGSHLAARQLVATDLVDETPALHVAQPVECAPVVAADDAGADDTDPWERPDTLVGALEVPDPAGGALALDAVRETGGWALGVSDDDALEAAVALAGEGVEASATGGVGAAAALELAKGGHLDGDDTVVLVNPVAGNKENDVLRSHLMRRGV